jgi:hypothetical protein
MASLSELHRESRAKADGYAGWRTGTYAVSVATGRAAERRGHPGKIVTTVEWYRPEGFDDDDASRGGFALRIKSGHARVSKDFVFEAIDVASIRDAIPASIRDMIED